MAEGEKAQKQGNGNELGLEEIDRLLRRMGIGIASQNAVQRIALALEEKAKEIGFEANMMLARQAERRHITEEDVSLALQ